jgi:ABC-type methionine transport system ATPase subunit
VDANILAGNINALVGGDVGYLVVSFEGEEKAVRGALSSLHEDGVEILKLEPGNGQNNGVGLHAKEEVR